MNWQKSLKNKVKNKEALKKHTSFKIGGPARYFYIPDDYSDLSLVIRLTKKHKVRILIIGWGSNILVSDKGVDALVVKLGSPFFKKIDFQGKRVEAGSGCGVNQLIRECARRGLSGTQFLAGIPGSIGGALVMNAGLPKENISDLVESVTVMDYNGKIKILPRSKIKFAYRNSDLSRYIILKAILKLTRQDKAQIKKDICKNMQHRKRTQDLAHPSAGCIFKNPGNESAGRLIDLCGLKGRKIGGAVISDIHANFIINKINAKAQDVSRLISLIKRRVQAEFNIRLEPEIKIWK